MKCRVWTPRPRSQSSSSPVTPMQLLLLIGTVLLVGFLVANARTQNMSLAAFVPMCELHSKLRISDPDSLGVIARSIETLPGLKLLDQGEDVLLVSADPHLGSMDRDLGLFVRISLLPDSRVQLEAQSKLFPNRRITTAALADLDRQLRRELGQA